MEVHPNRLDAFMKKSLENLQLDYVDLYLIQFPVGCKYVEGNVRPYVDHIAEVVTEGKTDHAALWRVVQIFTFSTKTVIFPVLENGRTSWNGTRIYK